MTPSAPGFEDEHANALPAGSLLGEYTLERVVGEGGFGIVYLAWDPSLQRKVAIKEYMPSELAVRSGDKVEVEPRSQRHRGTFEAGLRSFINEGRALAQFDHPSLVKVYRFWEANGTAYMVMPFYEGVTLRDHVRAMRESPGEAWLLELLEPLTEALQVIHRGQWLHRDIAPDNVILLHETGSPLLLDFGAARHVISDMTRALTVILKPGYAPIEQYAEIPNLKQGPWTDVYALAAVVHWVITGSKPPASVGRLVRDSYVPLVEAASGRYSRGFLHAIDSALAVQPSDRPQTIAAFRERLGIAHSRTMTGRGRHGGTDPDATVMRPHGQPAAEEPRSRSAAGWGAMIFSIAAAGATAAYLQLRESAPSQPAPAPAAGVAKPLPVPDAPAPPPAMRAETIDVPREFERIVAAQAGDFQVDVRPVAARLRVAKDEFRLKLSSNKNGFYYVLSLEPDGKLLLLWPNANEPSNRVSANKAVVMPAKGAMVAAEPAGKGSIIAIVSAQPRDFSWLSPGKEAIFQVLPTGDAASALAAQRGTMQSSIYAGRPICEGRPGCSDAYGAALTRYEVVR